MVVNLYCLYKILNFYLSIPAKHSCVANSCKTTRVCKASLIKTIDNYSRDALKLPLLPKEAQKIRNLPKKVLRYLAMNV
jgi:hypothetical protein